MDEDENADVTELVMIKPKFYDELITGAISLIAGAFITKLVDEAYAKLVIERRNNKTLGEG